MSNSNERLQTDTNREKRETRSILVSSKNWNEITNSSDSTTTISQSRQDKTNDRNRRKSSIKRQMKREEWREEGNCKTRDDDDEREESQRVYEKKMKKGKKGMKWTGPSGKKGIAKKQFNVIVQTKKYIYPCKRWLGFYRPVILEEEKHISFCCLFNLFLYHLSIYWTTVVSTEVVQKER